MEAREYQTDYSIQAYREKKFRKTTEEMAQNWNKSQHPTCDRMKALYTQSKHLLVYQFLAYIYKMLVSY